MNRITQRFAHALGKGPDALVCPIAPSTSTTSAPQVRYSPRIPTHRAAKRVVPATGLENLAALQPHGTPVPRVVLAGEARPVRPFDHGQI